jgi:hypothetical protein
LEYAGDQTWVSLGLQCSAPDSLASFAYALATNPELAELLL